MPISSASAAVFLPFGSLTGVVPVDAVPQARVLGDFGSVIGRGWLVAESAAIPVVDRSSPACTELPPSSDRAGGGGI
jgi:hypothetical protein